LWEKIDFDTINPSDIAYVFEFTNQITKDVFTIELEDLSLHKQFYNLFQLEVVNTLSQQDLSNAQLYLKDVGYYDYVVKYYDTTLPPPIVYHTCEVGIMRLIKDAVEKEAYEPDKPIIKQWK
jgi:citrate lyase gamma subunit